MLQEKVGMSKMECIEKACKAATSSGIPMAVVQLLDSKKYDVVSVEVLNNGYCDVVAVCLSEGHYQELGQGYEKQVTK